MHLSLVLIVVALCLGSVLIFLVFFICLINFVVVENPIFCLGW